ncbi:uncharacterized protein DSM5745_01615 [Aspergillus mulundensis]|uniref:Uncharacterized protein n=1 Tax=Aspergillus mulundensis TaxID=1810919 RepID=A0A3D8SU40_9EURO|nr:Uncharacterized protein DSM5745_01615 [Aspergillus mulundensis]RDW89840.1 Uncharacterized protein DSM5745_01615 [Aspergillus mulundensis]
MPDLSDDDLRALIEALAIEPPRAAPPLYGENTKQRIQEAIRKLPSTLRKKTLIFSPSAPVPTATLCTIHKRLNHDIIGHIFRLIQREVEDHLEIITQRYPGYPESLPPRALELVRDLQSLRGMWRNLGASRRDPPFQQNQCEACMVSRVIADQNALRNLRAALLSRTRERCSYRPPPKLSRFVEAALYNRHGELIQSLIPESKELSAELKRARKDAARRKSRRHSRRCDGTKCEPREASQLVFDHQLLHTPSDESPSKLTPSLNTKRRPSSQTVNFCLVPETIPYTVPSFELARKYQEEQEFEEQRKLQELQEALVYEIINAYLGSRTSSIATTTALTLNSRTSSCISPTSKARTDLPSRTRSDSLIPELSDWEDDWDERPITIQPGSPAVSQLMNQIGNMVVRSEGWAEPEPPSFRRAIEIVTPPSLNQSTASEYSEREADRSGWYPSDEESDAETIIDLRKGSEATTWSMFTDETDLSGI